MEEVSEEEFRERLKIMKEEGLKRTAQKKEARMTELKEISVKRKQERDIFKKKQILLEKETKAIEEQKRVLNEEFKKLREEQQRLAVEKEKLSILESNSSISNFKTKVLTSKLRVEMPEQHKEKVVDCKKKKTPGLKKSKTPILNLKQIQELRKKDRERKRVERENIKKDPERYLEYRLKEKLRNDRRKKNGNIKLISQMNRRSANAQRKQWRERQRRRRLGEKRKQSIDTPPNSPGCQSVNERPSRESRQSIAGKSTLKKNRYKEKQRLKELEYLQQEKDKRIDKWKKRFFREKSKHAASPSPKKMAKQILGKGRREVQRELVFGCALQKQITKNTSTCNTRKERREVSKIISGKVIKKSGNMKRLSNGSVSRYLQRKYAVNNACVEQKARVGRIQQIRNLVKQFFMDDENSVQAPGKSQCITRKKIKKQKRFLLDSVKNLHKSFLSTTAIKISYSTFNKLKPFWVVAPKESNRDTCKCVKHANFELMIKPLARMKILKVKSVREVLESVACSVDSKDCMYGNCDKCKNKFIKFTDMNFSNMNLNDEITYCKWIRTKVNKIQKGKPRNNTTKEVNSKDKKTVKQCNIVVKEKRRCTIDSLINQLNSYLPQFCTHVYNTYHQGRFLKKAKEELRTNEIILVVDWSENYSCRYAEEIQSMHFGGSRRQISLHTGVIYSKEAKLKATSFCTISSSKYHGPSAIWAHLNPVLGLIKKDFPDVDTIHFFSDGPTVQYRNKENFYLMARFACKFNFWKVSWNFSEAGHGKGPADAIGGVVKRTADSILLKQTDIIDVHSFKKAVSHLEVIVLIIDESKINEIESSLPSGLTAIPKTMKIHQIAWNRTNPQALGIRVLSCKFCVGTIVCSHFSIDSGIFTIADPIISERMSALPASTIDDLETDDHLDVQLHQDSPERDHLETAEQVKTGDWVSVIYDTTWYPGVVEEISENEMKINFMQRCGSFFVWPKKVDRQCVPLDGILCTLNPPVKVSSRLYKIENSDEIDKKSSVYID